MTQMRMIFVASLVASFVDNVYDKARDKGQKFAVRDTMRDGIVLVLSDPAGGGRTVLVLEKREKEDRVRGRRRGRVRFQNLTHSHGI